MDVQSTCPWTRPVSSRERAVAAEQPPAEHILEKLLCRRVVVAVEHQQAKRLAAQVCRRHLLGVGEARGSGSRHAAGSRTMQTLTCSAPFCSTLWWRPSTGTGARSTV